MNHDPMCSFQVPTSYCKECDLIARVREDERATALRDAVKAVMAYADKTHKHVGMFKCWPESGDRCDITAALRVAVVKIQELGGEQ